MRLADPASWSRDALSRDALMGESLAFGRLAARAACPVLLEGETGSGKTHLARLIHEQGPNAHGPFVRVNCGAIPPSLFERELFGHVRGAYTGAANGERGYLEAADGGTLFLDEVGEMPLEMQPKLLAVLEDGVFRKLGSPRESRVSVHVLAATNRKLTDMVRRGEFRQDLFYRLSVLQYRVPPLRSRPGMVPAITGDLLQRWGKAGLNAQVSPEAMETMTGYAWPGNVRELENALRHAVAVADGGRIELRHLPAHLREPAVDGMHPNGGRRYEAPESADREREMITDALLLAGGNRTHAARRLGMSRGTLWIKLQRYGMGEVPAARP